MVARIRHATDFSSATCDFAYIFLLKHGNNREPNNFNFRCLNCAALIQVCLDPTDSSGRPGTFFAAFQLPPWPFPVANHLIRMNEPPPRAGGVNVDLIEHSNGKIYAVTVRDIPQGAELFTGTLLFRI